MFQEENNTKYIYSTSEFDESKELIPIYEQPDLSLDKDTNSFTFLYH